MVSRKLWIVFPYLAGEEAAEDEETNSVCWDYNAEHGIILAVAYIFRKAISFPFLNDLCNIGVFLQLELESSEKRESKEENGGKGVVKKKLKKKTILLHVVVFVSTLCAAAVSP